MIYAVILLSWSRAGGRPSSNFPGSIAMLLDLNFRLQEVAFARSARSSSGPPALPEYDPGVETLRLPVVEGPRGLPIGTLAKRF